MTLGYHDASERDHYAVGFAATPQPPAGYSSFGSGGAQRQTEEWVRQEATRRGITPQQIRGEVESLVRQEAAKHGIPLSVDAARDQVEARVRAEAAKLGIPTSIKEARKIGEREAKKAGLKVGKEVFEKVGGPAAKKLVDDTLKNMKVPGNIPIVWPKEMSAEGVADAAMDAGAQWTENWLKAQTGFPIPVPRNLTPKELGKAIGGLIPGDAEEALDLAVSIGIQYASSAIASALAGAAIGSAIPGLGTVIGIGMALGYEALKEALKEPIPPHLKICPGRQLECPGVPRMSPIDQIPWVMEQRVRLTGAITAQQSKNYCGVGEMITCDRALANMAQESFNVIAGSTGRGSARGYGKSTPKVMGYYSILRAIGVYEKALPLRLSHVSGKAKRLNLRDRSGNPIKRWEITKEKGRTGQDIEIVLGWMRRRKVELAQLVATGNSIERMSAAQLASFRFTLITELAQAGRQYAFDAENPDTKQWLTTVGQFMIRLQKREDGVLQERKERKVQQTARFEQRKGDPREQIKHVLQQLQFHCGQGNAAACAEHRRISGGGALTAAQLKQFGGGAAPARSGPTRAARQAMRRGRVAQPAPRAAPAPRGVKVAETQARHMANAWLNNWATQNPAKAPCLTPRTRENLIGLFVAAHVKKTMTVPAATQRIAAILARC